MIRPSFEPMQDYALTVDRFLDHGAKWHGRARVVTSGAANADSIIDYATLRERANRLSGALLDLGLVPGDRIATLAWNTQHHVETWYGAMGVGLVCHTLNPRLTLAQLAAMIVQAEDRVLAVGLGLADMGRALMAACPCLERLILLDDQDRQSSMGESFDEFAFEDLLATRGRPVVWGDFDERSLAGLCFTSGTTGAPKGVAYTHRSNYLHTIRSLQGDAMALTAEDAVLVAVPMFHASAWGLPFAAPAVGARLVLPGRDLDGATLLRLINDHGVTVAVGVPTVWIGLLDHMDATGAETPSVKRIMIGGSSCPESLIRRMEERFGATVQASWGMTELSPQGVISAPSHKPMAARGAGRPPMGVDLLLTDEAGDPLPDQRNTVGRLKVKGHSVVRQYYGAEDSVLDADGWFDTGDLASIDDDGNLHLAGRSKDLIKSGGEWINPVEIEEIVGALPAIALVAVIGANHPRWGERPVMIVEPAQGQTVDDADLVASLKGRIADWWLPDRIIQIPAMPLAATGKINKTELRTTYGGA
ncbi:AMP-binding protein [Brevundimonas sp. NIBR11]|uniref:AMP-binding protein n=1 Tax=Brevundimonas sp. NIBR11 TaxID=3015999 RepID=UPI0022F03C05|nr:AMP-binding protein [Brevundimonas sp. NIBR11]WGM30559.1 3-methylmercaptopropionyl-CoA ligase [Brevundimonas sp. NIBR11]